jgi:Ser/Thr protein kinase RdoA (MazF antagonist)
MHRLTPEQLEIISREFDLGLLLGYEPLSGGSSDAFKLRTNRGAFFIRSEVSEQELSLYSQVEEKLNRIRVHQAHLYRTGSGSFLSSTGYAAFDFLAGTASDQPTPPQFSSFLQYFARYNLALRDMAVPSFVKAWLNPWDKADSLDYLLRHLPAQLGRLKLTPLVETTTATVLNFLAGVEPELNQVPKQLVHGDVGPGNILYEAGRAVAIIDFTPYYESHLYSLCVSLYWHYVYFNHGRPDFDRIGQALATYAGIYPFSDQEKRLFYAMFVKAAARMLFVLLVFNLEDEGRFFDPECEEKATILKTIMASRNELEDAIIN